MNEGEHQQVAESNGTPGRGLKDETGAAAPPGLGIGDLFKRGREDRGLTHEQVSKTIRVRPYFLEALENEDWERLPSPVFVIGFIRSYSRALGLDEENMVACYQQASPPELIPPRPLAAPAGRRKASLFFLIFLLLGTAAAYYVWNEYPTNEDIDLGTEAVRSEKKISPDSMSPQTQLLVAKEVTPSEAMEVRAAVEPPQEEPGPEEMKELIDEVLPIQLRKQAPATGQAPPNPQSSPGVSPANPEAQGRKPLVLRGHVREMTYIRIFIDDQAPKEYMFRPGGQPEWEAMRGFELLIGNAGGIDFELNGKKVGPIGRSGQVVRVRLPGDYDRR
jgi:cytoskeleton protein RodZ